MAAFSRIELAEDAYEEALSSHGGESAASFCTGVELGEAHCEVGNLQQARIALERALATLQESAVWVIEGGEYLKELRNIYHDGARRHEYVQDFFSKHDTDKSGFLQAAGVCILCRDLCTSFHSDLSLPTSTHIMECVHFSDPKLTDALELNDWERAFRVALKSVILYANATMQGDASTALLAASRLKIAEVSCLYESLAFIYGVFGDHKQEKAVLKQLLSVQESIGDSAAAASVSERLADVLGCSGASRDDIQQQLILLERAEKLGQAASLRKIGLSMKSERFEAGRLQPYGTLQADSQLHAIDGVARFFLVLLSYCTAEPVGGMLMLKQHGSMVSTLEGVSAVLMEDQLSDLEKLMMVIETASVTHGAESIQVAQWMYILATMFSERGDFELKRDTLQKVLNIQQKKFGFDSLFLSWTLKGLAHANGQLGNLEKKFSLLKRAYDLEEEELGTEHAQTRVTWYFLQQVGERLRALDDPDGSKELIGLFGRQVPLNKKINRYTQREDQFPHVAISNLNGSNIEPPQEFLMNAYGGGSCEFCAEAGIRVPFYFSIER